jgi:peptidoglycan/LPS O-acetylase OafA/YrhL
MLFPALQFHLPGVFANLPFASAVNGSLWTLPAEAIAYGVIAGAGFIGVLRYRALGPLFLIAYWAYGWHVAPTIADKNVVHPYLVIPGCLDCYHYFLMGSVIYLYRDKITLSGYLACLLVLLQICTAQTPFFRLVMRFALPYVVLYLAYCRVPLLARFGRRGDYSYGIYIYAYPIQQLCLHLWGPRMSPGRLFVCALGATLLCAVLSWHLVEAPALRLKRLMGRAKKPKDQGREDEGAGEHDAGELRAAA